MHKTESSVRKYEKGLVEIPLSVLNDIANALGVAINTFLPPPLTPSQEILNEIIPSKYSLEEIATLANVPICELQAIYTGSQGSTVGTYFKLYSFLGLDETTILNIMMSDSCIDVAYNHDSSDPLKNALFKHYTEQPLTLDELLVSIADDDKPLIESLYYQGMIPNTDTYKAPIKSIPNTSILNTLGYTLKPTKNKTICQRKNVLKLMERVQYGKKKEMVSPIIEGLLLSDMMIMVNLLESYFLVPVSK